MGGSVTTVERLSRAVILSALFGLGGCNLGDALNDQQDAGRDAEADVALDAGPDAAPPNGFDEGALTSALAYQQEVVGAAEQRLADGDSLEDVTLGVEADLRTRPELIDVDSLVLSETGRALAWQTHANGIPMVFFATRYAPSPAAKVAPLPTTSPPAEPRTIPSHDNHRVLILDPEATRPRLHPLWATSGEDLKNQLLAAGFAPADVTHRTAELSLDDYRSLQDYSVVYVHAHGDAFYGFGALLSAAPVAPADASGIRVLVDQGLIVQRAPLSEQPVLVTPDGAELAVTQQFFSSPELLDNTMVYLDGMSASADSDAFETVFATTRGAELYAANLRKQWSPDVSYVAYRVFEELLDGHPVQDNGEVGDRIAAGLLRYANFSYTLTTCGSACAECPYFLGELLGDIAAGAEICDDVHANNRHDDAPPFREAAEAAKTRDDDGDAAGASRNVTAGVPTNTAPASCTKQVMDQELQQMLTAFNAYVAGLSGFRGCLDITQDLLGIFIRLSPKVVCWDKGIAWRMTVSYTPLVCISNFMHNAFFMWPLTTQYGHTLQVLDPYTFFGWQTHTAKVQTASPFLDGASCGGFEYGATGVTKGGEAARAQKCVDGNADLSDCADMYACLQKEFPSLVNNCQ